MIIFDKRIAMFAVAKYPAVLQQPIEFLSLSTMKKVITSEDTNREAKLQAFDRLLTVMDELRENCPWDKKQTLESLRHLTIEETYELSDAILEGNLTEVKKELGDLMLHLVFYSRIASELKAFDVADVLHSICDKLVGAASARLW